MSIRESKTGREPLHPLRQYLCLAGPHDAATRRHCALHTPLCRTVVLCRWFFLRHAENLQKNGLSVYPHRKAGASIEKLLQLLEVWRTKPKQLPATMLSRTAGILARRSAATTAASVTSRAAPKAAASALAARFQPTACNDFESTNLIGGGMWPSSSAAASASSAVAGYHTSAGLMMPIKVVEVSVTWSMLRLWLWLCFVGVNLFVWRNSVWNAS